MRAIWLMTILTGMLGVASVYGADIMKAFPPAGSGMVRYVLQLPAQEDESLLKVELLVGQMVRTDAINLYFLGGKIEQETIKGFGYTIYKVSKIGPMAGTLIAVDPDEPKVDRFITLGGGPYLIRYNSKLPVVVYVPEGTEVRYRIWSTGAETKTMEKG
jgi:ecotin